MSTKKTAPEAAEDKPKAPRKTAAKKPAAKKTAAKKTTAKKATSKLSATKTTKAAKTAKSETKKVKAEPKQQAIAGPLRLSSLSPRQGKKIKRLRVGRGIGTGIGKTCGKGHKGQRARAGGYHKVGFEGGQMPMQRRLPKSGFRSQAKLAHEEIRLSQLNKIQADVVDFSVLREQAVIKFSTKTVKIILSGSLDKAINVRGIPMTKGAKAAILALGGKVD